MFYKLEHIIVGAGFVPILTWGNANPVGTVRKKYEYVNTISGQIQD
jgi:hypothetical protein